MRKLALKLAGIGALAVVASSVMPGTGAADTEVIALVASNAQGAFTEIIKEFQTKHAGVTVKPQYLGGTDIGNMVDTQARADVILVGSGTTDKEANLLNAPEPVLRNREVILVPKGNPGNIKTLKDIGNAGVKIAIGTPASAVGKLASQVIQNAAGDLGFDFVQKIRGNIAVQADKGSDIVAAVVSGKANAAIAFQSDKDDAKFTVVPIEDKYNVVSTYNMAVPKNAKNTALAQDLIKLVAGSDGQAVLRKYNYMAPK